MGINKEPYVRINRTNYLDEEGLDALWVKIKEYVALHGGDGEGIDLTQYTTKEELATELSKYYNKTEIDALLSNLSPDVDLSNYYTKTEVDQKINDIDIPATDLSNYYTKQETYNKTEVNNLIASSGGGEGTGADGFSPIARVEQTETGATITITDKTGTTTATVTNGQDGSNGTDGYSPTIVENSGNNASTYKLDITTKDSTFTTPNLKGADGVGGEVDLSDYYTKTEVDTKLEEVVAGDIDLTNYYTKTEVDQKIESIPETDLSNYYTKTETYNKTEIDTKLEEVVAGDLDLSTYAKIDYVDKGDNLEMLEDFTDYTLDGNQVEFDYNKGYLSHDYDKLEFWDDENNVPDMLLVTTTDNSNNVIDDYIKSENGKVNLNRSTLQDIIIYGTSNGFGTTKDNIEELDPEQLDDYSFKLSQQMDRIENPPIPTYAGGTKIKINQNYFYKFYATDKQIDDTHTLIESYKMMCSDDTDTLILPDTQTGYLKDYIIFQPCGNYSNDIPGDSITTQTGRLSVERLNCRDDYRNPGEGIDVRRFTYQSYSVPCKLYHIDTTKAPAVYVKGMRIRATSEPYKDGELIRSSDYVVSGGLTPKLIPKTQLKNNPYLYIWYGDNASGTYYDGDVLVPQKAYLTYFKIDVYNLDETQHKEVIITWENTYNAAKPYVSEYLRYCSDDVIIKKSSSEYPYKIYMRYTYNNVFHDTSFYLKNTLYKNDYIRFGKYDLKKRIEKQTTKNYVYVDNLLNGDGTKYEPSTGEGQDGFSPTATVTQTSTGAIITITDKNGTTSATITNGEDGQDGTNGTNGTDGEDGFSPTIVENAGNNSTTYKLDITTKTSTFTTPNLKGADGTGGGGSGSGFNPFDYSNTDEVAVGTWVDGKTIYRKYFTWTVETNQTNFPQDIHHNIENLEATVLIEGFIKYGTTCIPINSMTLNQVYSGSNLTVSKFNEWLQGNFRIMLTDTLIRIGPTDKGGYTAYMFVYYTKSS